MKKIAIASCYFHHNYGSMLQALATQMVLDKLGYSNETIDISGFKREILLAKILYFFKASLTSDIFFEKIGMVKNRIKRRISKGDYARNVFLRDSKFDEFYKKHFRLSSVYNSKQQLGEKCKEKYSAVLVGSDQLWLPGNIAADYYTLTFVPESVNSISYATSFGQAELPKTSAQKAKKFLKNIRHVSVREEAGQKIVEKVANRKVPVVCDPTLLFDGDEWLIIQNIPPIVSGKYILCYFLGNNSIHRDFAIRLRKETGYKIVALIHLDEFIKGDEKYADETPYDVNPADFLNLIRNAEYVCTDSFHCSVFSILYKRNFFTFHRYHGDTKQSTNSRMDTLFNMVGIKDRLLAGNEEITECLKIYTDYNIVDKKIDNVRKKSYEYLRTALEDQGNTDLR